MIDNEIELIIYSLKFQSKEISKYLRKQRRTPYDFYVDELLGYVDGFAEDLDTIKKYILKL